MADEFKEIDKDRTVSPLHKAENIPTRKTPAATLIESMHESYEDASPSAPPFESAQPGPLYAATADSKFIQPVVEQKNPYSMSYSQSDSKLAGLSFFSLNVSKLSYQSPDKIYRLREFVRSNIIGKLPIFARRPLPVIQKMPSLSNVNFVARGGKITGLLGPEKERTVLIELIVGRRRAGIASGDIFMKGSLLPMTTSYFENLSYVPEKPLFVPGLTYAELLRYAISLKMSNLSHSAQFVEDRLEDLLTIMDLQQCKNRKIPDRPHLKGEIGCDFRRLGIAMDIASLPPLIVINEPTLDFDPAISVLVMQCMKKLSERGHAVVLSLSRPYKQELMKIDNVVLLSEGHSIFSSAPRNIVKHFCSPSVGYVLKDGGDVVDFLLDIASGVERPTDKRTADLPSQLQEDFELTEYFDPPQASVAADEDCPSVFDPNHYSFLGYIIKEKPSVFVHRAYVIVHRAVSQKIKDTEAVRKMLVGCIFISTLFGYLDYQQAQFGYYSTSLLNIPYINTQNVSALLFFMCAFLFVFPSVNTSAIVAKVKLFRYEQAAGYCTIPAFYLATVISEGLLSILYSTIFGTILYFMAGLGKGLNNYLFCVYVMGLMMFVGQGVIFSCASIFKRERMARDMFFLAFIMQLFVGGFVFPINKLSDNFVFTMAGFSPLRWSFEGVMSWKYSFYADGDAYLGTYGFDTFSHNDCLEILGNFFLVSQGIFLLSLISSPNLLDIRKGQPSDSRPGSKNIDPMRQPSADEEFVLDSLPPTFTREASRQSELVKPALFVRASLSPNLPTKLSMNVSQTGELNTSKGPTVMFRDITFKVRDRRSPLGHKTILDHVSGQFDWGKLSLILGAPESGKSSLIHILAGDVVKNAEITGDILLNGERPDSSVPLWQRCALVPVECYHLRDLTVREVLTFAMTLRCSHRGGFSFVEDNVDLTLEILHLTDLADIKTKFLSPGAVKRLSIAEEMVHGPKLLYLDEPTTGVDLVEQIVLMTTFREMVNQDRTVVASIKHPTVEEFNLFDTLLLLSKGRVIYYGNTRDSTAYFTVQPLNFDDSHYPNPADFLTDLSSGFVTTKTATAVDSTNLEERYKESESYMSLFKRLQDIIVPIAIIISGPESDGKNPLHISNEDSVNNPRVLSSSVTPPTTRGVQNFLSLDRILLESWKLKTLVHRSFLTLCKRRLLVIGSFALLVLISATFGWVMGDSNNTSNQGVANVNAFIAMGSLFVFFSNIQFIFYLYNNQQVYLRENSRGLYNSNFGWLCSSPPLYILRALNAVLFCVVVYTMIRLDRSSGMYGFFILCFVVFTLCTTLITELVVYLNDDIDGGYLGLTAIAAAEFIFSGLFIKAKSLPG